MKIHLTSIAVLALGFGCTGETSEAGSTSPSGNEPSQAADAAAAPDTVAPRVENVDAASAAELLAESQDVVVLDIRTPAEYESGHLKGAVNIDYRADDFTEKLAELDRDKTYLVH